MNLDHTTRPSDFAAPASLPEPVIYDQLRAYKEARRQRSQTKQASHNRRHPALNRADEIVQFAHSWAPYGGAPAEETIPRFGVSGRAFTDRLWHAVQELDCDARIVRQLADVYPQPRS